jgi:hypothetical protein
MSSLPADIARLMIARFPNPAALATTPWRADLFFTDVAGVSSQASAYTTTDPSGNTSTRSNTQNGIVVPFTQFPGLQNEDQRRAAARDSSLQQLRAQLLAPNLVGSGTATPSIIGTPNASAAGTWGYIKVTLGGTLGTGPIGGVISMNGPGGVGPWVVAATATTVALADGSTLVLGASGQTLVAGDVIQWFSGAWLLQGK